MEIVAISSMSILWIYSEPMILLKRYFGFKEENFQTMGKIKRFFHKLIYCSQCSSFWIALILTGGDIYSSSIISVLTTLIDKQIMK
jgi:hypothetical protein